MFLVNIIKNYLHDFSYVFEKIVFNRATIHIINVKSAIIKLFE